MTSLIVVLHPIPASVNVLTVCLHLIQGEHLAICLPLLFFPPSGTKFYFKCGMNGEMEGNGVLNSHERWLNKNIQSHSITEVFKLCEIVIYKWNELSVLNGHVWISLINVLAEDSNLSKIFIHFLLPLS